MCKSGTRVAKVGLSHQNRKVDRYASLHRRRKWGGKGATRPPSFKLGGIARPPNFTYCSHNELHCSIVDGIACRHCSSRKSHFCCLKKCRPPQVRTSSYAYALDSSLTLLNSFYNTVLLPVVQPLTVVGVC